MQNAKISFYQILFSGICTNFVGKHFYIVEVQTADIMHSLCNFRQDEIFFVSSTISVIRIVSDIYSNGLSYKKHFRGSSKYHLGLFV